jgi:hypothetical protein
MYFTKWQTQFRLKFIKTVVIFHKKDRCEWKTDSRVLVILRTLGREVDVNVGLRKLEVPRPNFTTQGVSLRRDVGYMITAHYFEQETHAYPSA